jgi:hypothetical protein
MCVRNPPDLWSPSPQVGSAGGIRQKPIFDVLSTYFPISHTFFSDVNGVPFLGVNVALPNITPVLEPTLNAVELQPGWKIVSIFAR